MRRKNMIVIGAVAAVCSASAAELSNAWKIVTPPQKTPVIRYAYEKAAEILKKDLAEGAGLKLEIVKEVPASGHAIVLGAEAAKQAGLDVAGLKWYDNAIVEKGGILYLFGNDRARKPDQPYWDWHKAALPTLGAAVRFLHDYLGDRFCAPGETGRRVGRREKVVVPDGTVSIERPTQIFGTACQSDIYYSYANGLRGMGLFHTYGGHTYPVAVPMEKYSKDHPEYFALTKDGRRTWGPTNGQTALCISNPEVEELILNEMLSRYDAGAEACQLGTQDGSNHCWCEKCMALYGTDDWCEKTWLYHKHIAERIEKLRPGKIVHILSYDITKTPPKTFTKFPSNVMVEQCRTSEEAFHEWDGYEVPHGFTVYTYLWGEYPRPGYTAKNSCDYLAWFARFLLKNRVHGIYRCGYGELFGTEGPGYYVFNSLLGDPDLNVRSLVNEYCERAYGPASAPMLLFHDTLDGRLGSKPGKAGPPGLAAGLQLDHFAYVYSPDATKVMDAALARAEATPGLTDKQRKRIALVRTEYDYARNLGRIATLYAAYKAQPSWALFDPLAEQVVARNAMLDSLYTGPKGAMRAVEGWPEIRLFGAMRRSMMAVNGRLGATLGAPLGWDVKYLKERGVLPGAAKKTVKAAREASAAEWNDLGGVQLQKIDKAARFRVSYDERALRIEMESDLDDGVKVKDYGRDAAVWGDESADILIDPTGQGDKVYHLIWSPVDGAVYDEAYGLVTDVLDPKFGTFDPYWNGKGWAITNVRRDNRWLTAVEIPFAMLGVSAPKPGDRWRLNVAREWNISCRGNPPAVAALWSPNLETGSFLNRDAMGELTF